jgi:hypothetical protein
LDTKGLVTADNKVGPLYEHVFPPTLAPSLSFVGLPQKVIPFPLSQLQARWIAKVLSGKVQLPSQSEMMKSVQAFYAQFEASGSPMDHLHYLQGDSQVSSCCLLWEHFYKYYFILRVVSNTDICAALKGYNN